MKSKRAVRDRAWDLWQSYIPAKPSSSSSSSSFVSPQEEQEEEKGVDMETSLSLSNDVSSNEAITNQQDDESKDSYINDNKPPVKFTFKSARTNTKPVKRNLLFNDNDDESINKDLSSLLQSIDMNVHKPENQISISSGSDSEDVNDSDDGKSEELVSNRIYGIKELYFSLTQQEQSFENRIVCDMVPIILVSSLYHSKINEKSQNVISLQLYLPCITTNDTIGRQNLPSNFVCDNDVDKLNTYPVTWAVKPKLKKSSRDQGKYSERVKVNIRNWVLNFYIENNHVPSRASNSKLSSNFLLDTLIHQSSELISHDHPQEKLLLVYKNDDLFDIHKQEKLIAKDLQIVSSSLLCSMTSTVVIASLKDGKKGKFNLIDVILPKEMALNISFGASDINTKIWP